MMPQKQHIVTRKKGKLLQIWLAEEYIIQQTGVGYDYLRVKRNSSKSWDFITHSGTRFYEYYSIPDRAPSNYRSRLPEFDDLLELIAQKEVTDTGFEPVFEEALTRADSYTYIYKLETEGRRMALGRAAAVTEAACAYINATHYNLRSNELIDEMSRLCRQHNVYYLPQNARRLKQKIMQRIAGTPLSEIVKAPRAGNNNAAKYKNDSELEAWVFDLAANPKNFSDQYICRKVQELCSLTGKAIPANETIRALLNDRSVKYLTSVSRHGSGTREAADYEASIPVAKAVHAGDCWQIDATRVNLIAHERSVADNDGKKKTVLANLMVCAVRDVYSGKCLGYSFDYAENYIMYHNALKLAVQEAGYLPYELVADKFPGHNKPEGIQLRETFQFMGVKWTTTSRATGKAQVERWFNTMQQVEMQGHDYYYGEGIRSTRAHAHASPDHIAKMKRQAKNMAFNMQDTIDIYSGMIESHNARHYSQYSRKLKHLHKSPADLHAESEKPNTIAVSDQKINHIFGAKTDVKIKANGLFKIELRHIDHYYLITDYDIVEKNARVCVSYDPNDMTSVCVYKRVEGSSWLLFLCRSELFKQPQIYGPQAEMGRLAELKKQNREFERRRQDELNKKLGVVAESGSDDDEIYNDEESLLMGRNTLKKAACGYEDLELNLNESIHSQLFTSKY